MGITNSKEYAARVTLNLNQVRKMQTAQRNIYDQGFKENNYSKLKDLLSTGATVLGLIFLRSTGAAIATGVSSLVTGLAPNAKSTLQGLVYEGYWQMGYLEDYLADNPKYDQLDVLLPFIEYTVDGERIRFVTGKGVVKRVHSKTGWITL